MPDAREDRAATAFVASLLPARFLVERAVSLNIRTVVVVSPIHEQSYAYVAERVPGLRVARLQGGTLRVATAIAWALLSARARRRDVVFFHECCWPVFDLLIGVVKPTGSFFPQVTMAGFDAVEPTQVRASSGSNGRAKALFLRLFASRFRVYRAPKNSGAAGYDYFPSYRRYPPSIRVFPVAAQQARPGGGPARGRVRSARVIFIGGTEVAVPDDDLRRMYEMLIQIARDAGYTVFIKDHPLSRLNINGGDACVAIDPAMPVELVDQSFDFAISVASTALLTVGDRKIAFVNALEAMPENVKQMRVNHLLSLPGGDAVEFVSSADDVRRALVAARLPGER